MRFHCGFSFRPRLSFKWLILGLFGLGALFFGNILSVFAYSNNIGFYPDLVYGYDSSNQQVTESLQLTTDTFYFDTAGTDYNYGYWSSYYSTYFQNNTCRYINMTTWFKAYNPNLQLLNRGLSISAKYHGTTNGISGRIIDSGNGYIANEWYNIDTTKRFDFGVYTGGATGYIEGPLIVTYECVVTETDQIIANDNSNTQQIINNNSQNTQDIINNNNQNTQDIIDSNKVCSYIDKNSTIQNGFLSSNGSIISTTYWGVTDFYPIDSNSTLTIIKTSPDNLPSFCFYNNSKSLLSCIENNTLSLNDIISIPFSASFVRFSIKLTENIPQFSICKNGSQAIADSQQQINDSLTNDNVNGALDTGNDFFDNFQINDSRGFSAIVTAPIQFLRDLLTSQSSCNPLNIGFNPSDGVHSGSASWSIPCGDILWSKAPSSVILLWETLIWGILGYRVLVDLFKFIQRMLDPEDKSEFVMRL